MKVIKYPRYTRTSKSTQLCRPKLKIISGTSALDVDRVYAVSLKSEKKKRWRSLTNKPFFGGPNQPGRQPIVSRLLHAFFILYLTCSFHSVCSIFGNNPKLSVGNEVNFFYNVLTGFKDFLLLPGMSNVLRTTY